jgi:hypothetical protein
MAQQQDGDLRRARGGGGSVTLWGPRKREREREREREKERETLKEKIFLRNGGLILGPLELKERDGPKDSGGANVPYWKASFPRARFSRHCNVASKPPAFMTSRSCSTDLEKVEGSERRDAVAGDILV